MRDKYVNSLHQRIRELEDVCLDAGTYDPNVSAPQRRLSGGSTRQEEMTRWGYPSVSSVSRYSRLGTTEQNPTPVSSTTKLAPWLIPPCTQAGRDDSHTSSAGENRTNFCESPLFDNHQGRMTGMGRRSCQEPRGKIEGDQLNFSFMVLHPRPPSCALTRKGFRQDRQIARVPKPHTTCFRAHPPRMGWIIFHCHYERLQITS